MIAKDDLLLRLRGTFTPSGPVQTRAAFAGRDEQRLQLAGAIAQPGRHAIVYGERGVGKTSLTNVLPEMLAVLNTGHAPNSVRVNCDDAANFRTLWTQIAYRLGQPEADTWETGDPRPEDVRRMLEQVRPPTVVVIDEYDRLADDAALSMMADTIKTLSDNLVGTKLVLVGVADTIDALIGEHESVRRAIEQVLLPRMTPNEIIEVVSNGLERVEMQASQAALHRISRMAEGLPSYAHALPLHAASRAVMSDRITVEVEDVEAAAGTIVQTHSSRSLYLQAVSSPHGNNNYPAVLAACALAEKDELGYFTPAAVREPLSRVLGRPVDIPNYTSNLSGFLTHERGEVLQRIGEARRRRFRFRDPMLQPFAIMAAADAGVIPTEYKDSLYA